MGATAEYLNPPTVKSVRYDRNFIKTAVCELRFPTLLKLENNPPTDFQAKIRRNYPFYEPQLIEQVGRTDGMSREHHYLFRSKDKNWTVAVKSFSIALETSKYIDFDSFFTRFVEILDSAKEMIDSDFFTRVGLRYMNSVPLEDRNPAGWIRSDLICAITGGVLGVPKSYRSIVQGRMEEGEYTFRHGLDAGENPNQPDAAKYILDFDYFKEGVELDDVQKLVKGFNERNFSFFSWCLDEKAKAILGEGKPK